jgi:hypothetical protein
MNCSQQTTKVSAASSVTPGPWCMWVFIATLLLVASVAGSVFFYAYPTGDDLCRAGTVSRLGILSSIAAEYQHWSGRWLGNGLEYVIFALPNFPQYYGLILALILAVYGVALVMLVGSLCGDVSGRAGRWIAPLGLLALYWVGLPSIKDTVYWMTGAVEYQLSVAMALFVMALLVRFSRRPRHFRPLGVALCGDALSWIHGGFSPRKPCSLCVAGRSNRSRHRLCSSILRPREQCPDRVGGTSWFAAPCFEHRC